MKKRILTGWTFTRIIYLLIGGFVMAQSVINREWIGLAIGGYFAAMGLFAFGCAAGHCFGSSCNVTPPPGSNNAIQEMEFDEIKTK